MRRALLLLLLFSLTGCATYTQPMNDPFVVANQTQTLIQGLVGPNNISGGIITGQNYYRNAVTVTQNPWYGYDLLRGLWHR